MSEAAKPAVAASRVDATKALRLTPPVSIVAALLVVAGVIGARAVGSDGFYWGDDYAHLLISRSAAHDWHALLNVWGRPLMTVVYIPAALISEAFVRVTSLLLLLTTAALVAFTARRWGLPHPLLAGLMLLAQPLVAMIGFSALPQTLFSALLAGAFALRASGHHSSSVVLLSFLPLARLDGIAVLGVWALVLVIEHRYRLVPVLASGLALWAVCGALVYSDPLWLYHANPYGLLGSVYGAAGFSYGFAALATTSGAVVIACALAAIPSVRHIDPALWLTAGGLFAFYVAAWTLPAFQTLASPVYLVCLSVPIALLAHQGVVRTLTAWPERGGVLAIALAGAVCLALATRSTPVVVIVVVLLAFGMLARSTWLQTFSHTAGVCVVVMVVLAITLVAARRIDPLPLADAAHNQAQIATVLGPDVRRVVVSTHPAFDWFSGQRTFVYLYGGSQKVRVGDYIIWDGNVGPRLVSLEDLRKQGYTVRWTSGEGTDRVVLLELTQATPNPQ